MSTPGAPRSRDAQTIQEIFSTRPFPEPTRLQGFQATAFGILSLATGLLLFPQGSTWAQTVTATVAVGHAPEAMAINTVTNRIYVANYVGGTVTIIDGATDATTTVSVGTPVAVAVNEATNKIYIATGSPVRPGSNGITVIDGATNSTTTITDPDMKFPRALAVNPVTNKIYVANFIGSHVTVVDGATNSTTTITDPNASGLAIYAIAVNEVTNKIYALNNNIDRAGSTDAGSITVIDGATNSTTTITDPNAITPVAVAVNPVTNKIYVANRGRYPGANHGNVTVIDGATNSTTTVTDPSVLAPQAVAVNPATNKIYVANINDSALSQNGGVTVIDGATNAISNVRDPNAIAPSAVSVDQATNRIYVANYGLNPPTFGSNSPGSVTVIDGSTNSVTNLVDTNAVNPTAVSMDSATGRAYVANVYSDNVTVIDGAAATPTDFTLSVVEAGTGAGVVTSSPPAISCPNSCSASLAGGTVVTLIASAAPGSAFAGWGGGCSGTGSCMITVNSTESITATFEANPAADFSLHAVSSALTLQPGMQGTDVISFTPENGSFTSPIGLSCSVNGPSPKVTCGLSPASVTLGANTSTSTLTIKAPALTAVLPVQANDLQYAVFIPLPVFALLVLSCASAKSKRRTGRTWLLGALVVGCVVMVAGCGGGTSSVTNSPTPQNYTVTVTGTSGTLQHSVSISANVE
jgi:DNA-binding beta-propeller fold protein YncE